MRRVAVLPVLVLVAALATRGLLAQSKPSPSPSARTMLPLCRTGCGGGGGSGSPVDVTPHGAWDTLIITSSPAANSGVAFTVTNIGSSSDTYTLTMTCTGAESCISQDYTSISLSPSASIQVHVSFRPGQPNTSGTVSLTASDGGGLNKEYAPKVSVATSGSGSSYSSTGSYNVVSILGPAPIISLAPYSSGLQAARGGVVYQHALPAVGSMGASRSLALAYNSAAARPTAVVAVDVSNYSEAVYPSVYQLQVQRADNLAYLTLLNGATSVYYSAASSTQASRLAAAIDLKANGLTTGAYAVNVVVTALYTLGTIASSVPTRLLVNDQSGSPYGAGVGLVGVGRLYPNPISGYGELLVDGTGAMAYFDRSCATCTPFVSAAGDSRTLTMYNDPTYGWLYRLTATNGSITDFRVVDGTLLRTLRLPGIRDLAITYTNGWLTSIADTTGQGFSLSYTNGMLTQVSDFSGRSTGIAVVGGQLSTVTDPDGLTESLTYGANSLLTQLIDRAGGHWTFTYNALNEKSSVTGPAATDFTGAQVRPVTSVISMAQVVWQPSIAGTSATAPKANVRPDTVMLSVTDPLGSVARAAHDRFGQVTKVVDPLGQVTTITRDTLGHATQTVQPNGHSVTYSYSGYLLTAHTDNTTGAAIAYSYDGSNRLIRASGGGARHDYYYHDGSQGPAGALKLEYIGNTGNAGVWPPRGGDTLVHHYPDAFGRDTAITDGLGHRSHSVFAAPTAGGNLLQTVDALGHLTSYRYNRFGLDSARTLVTGWVKSHATDVMNRDTVASDPFGALTHYSYAPLGLTRIVDPKGQTYRFDLNGWALTTAGHDLADSSRVDLSYYDVGGLLRRIRTRRGDTISMTYDALGRVLTRINSGTPPDSATFRYGLNGAWMVATNRNAYDSITFDQVGRRTGVWQRVHGVTYGMSYYYDSQGRLVFRTGPGGGIITGSNMSIGYDANLGQLDTICAVGTCAVLTFDAEMNPTRVAYDTAGQPSSWSHIQVFDSLHQIRRDSFTVSALHSDFGAAWAYDSLGHVVSAQTPTTGSLLPKFFSYDANGRLTNACTYYSQYCWNEYGSILAAYSYDAAGNRNDHANIGPGNRVLQFNNYRDTFDLNGALLQKSGLGNSPPWNSLDTTQLQWNSLGQLTRAKRWTGSDSTVDTFLYDALGHRVAKSVNGSTTWFLYDGGQVVMDVSSSDTMTAEYAWAGGTLLALRTPAFRGVAITVPTNGTVVGLAAAQNGSEIKRYDVLATPWSQQSPDTGFALRFRMGSQEYDQEIGLYHLGARYYDPQMGRFLSEDPIGISGGLNLYAYTGNDPINRRDPTGLDECFEDVIIQGIVDASGNFILVTNVIVVGWEGGCDGSSGHGGNSGRASTIVSEKDPCRLSTPGHDIVVDDLIAQDVVNATAMAEDWGISWGRTPPVNNGYRDPQTQQGYFDAWKRGDPGANRAARPGHSCHNAGSCLDMNQEALSDNDYDNLVTVMARNGFTQTVSDEPWHFESDLTAHNQTVRDAMASQNGALAPTPASTKDLPACKVNPRPTS